MVTRAIWRCEVRSKDLMRATAERTWSPAGCGPEVWALCLRRDPAPYGLLLSEGESARAAAMMPGPVRRRFIVRRGMLRCLIAERLGLDAAAIEVTADARGRPIVAGQALHVSLSSSGDRAVCALSRGPQVGIDIEQRRPVHDIRTLALTVLSPHERRVLAFATAPEDELTTVLRAWTGKEAVCKGTGLGLGLAPDTVDVLDTDGSLRPVVSVCGLGRWRLTELDSGGDALCTYAIEAVTR